MKSIKTLRRIAKMRTAFHTCAILAYYAGAIFMLYVAIYALVEQNAILCIASGILSLMSGIAARILEVSYDESGRDYHVLIPVRIALIGILALVVFTSCSDECHLKHASTEPDPQPIFYAEYLDIKIGSEISYGYYTQGTDTAFSKAIAYEVKVEHNDTIRSYRISKQMYNFLASPQMQGDIMKCRIIDGDSLHMFGLALDEMYAAIKVEK